jgi:hypothetical protein
MNVKKNKIMVFNYANPCQDFVFEGDIIERVQTFKYLGILFETTPNLDNVVEHLVAASRRSLFALNRCWRTPNSLQDSNVSPSEGQRKKEESGCAP